MRQTDSIKRLVAAALALVASLTAGSAGAGDHPATVLLRTEIRYVVECLRNNEIAFARAHLDVIKAEFPQEKRIATYYDGVIAFRQEDWKAAAAAFSQLPPRDGHDDSDVLAYLFYCHLNLDNLSTAEKAIEELEKIYKPSRVSADARVALAQRVFHDGASGPARAYELVAGLATTYPDHPQRTWLAYADAERAWNALRRQLDNAKDKPLSDALAAEARACKSQYERLRRADPESDEATAADFRIAALRDLLAE